ncbi:hypothetical protein ABW19_dt0204766 [Dactylella cylindrospora]|nr:hypothetical protein ABW19_dt0204766 [Dactylella cylindrospora]
MSYRSTSATLTLTFQSRSFPTYWNVLLASTQTSIGNSGGGTTSGAETTTNTPVSEINVNLLPTASASTTSNGSTSGITAGSSSEASSSPSTATVNGSQGSSTRSTEFANSLGQVGFATGSSSVLISTHIIVRSSGTVTVTVTEDAKTTAGGTSSAGGTNFVNSLDTNINLYPTSDTNITVLSGTLTVTVSSDTTSWTTLGPVTPLSSTNFTSMVALTSTTESATKTISSTSSPIRLMGLEPGISETTSFTSLETSHRSAEPTFAFAFSTKKSGTRTRKLGTSTSHHTSFTTVYHGRKSGTASSKLPKSSIAEPTEPHTSNSGYVDGHSPIHQGTTSQENLEVGQLPTDNQGFRGLANTPGRPTPVPQPEIIAEANITISPRGTMGGKDSERRGRENGNYITVNGTRRTEPLHMRAVVGKEVVATEVRPTANNESIDLDILGEEIYEEEGLMR